MDRLQLQEISAVCLLEQLSGARRARLLRYVTVAIPCALLLIGAQQARAGCDQETMAQKLVFQPVKYNDLRDSPALQQLALHATVCVVTGVSAPGGTEKQITIVDNTERYGYLDTSVSAHDTPTLFWARNTDLIAQYDTDPVRQEKGASCALLGALTVLQSQIVRLKLQLLPGHDAGQFTFQGQKAQFVGTEADDCNSDPGGPHGAGAPVEFKINPQMGGCIVLRSGETHGVAWIPIKALLSNARLPIENYFTSSCNGKQDGQPNTPSARAMGLASRDQNQDNHRLDDLKGGILQVELRAAPPTPPSP